MSQSSKKEIIKRAYCLICLFLSLLMLCSCAENGSSITDPNTDDTGDKVTEKVREAPVLAVFGGEEMNPFAVQTRINTEMLALCYGGLFCVNEKWDSVPVIASGYSQSGAVFDISLGGIRFSDGTSVTAADCVYSYTLAEESEAYSQRFRTIISYEAVSNSIFRVEFKNATTANLNLLDIPVIKENSDISSEYPIGAGNFKLSREDNELYLVKNDYSEVSEYSYEKIKVIEANDYTSLLYDFNYGTVDALCASSSDGSVNYTGNIELLDYTSNKLVFFVVNSNDTYLSNRSTFTRALTSLISRKELSREVLKGSAEAVWYPFNPAWSRVAEAELVSDSYSLDDARQLFYEARIFRNAETSKMEWYGAEITLKILVCDEDAEKVSVAEYTAAILEEFGFTVNVVSRSSADYRAAIKNGEYDIYIGEVAIPANMDITGLISTVGGASAEVAAAAGRLNSSNADIRDFISVFRENPPLVPLYYKNRYLAVNLELNGEFCPCETSAFAGAETWYTLTD